MDPDVSEISPSLSSPLFKTGGLLCDRNWGSSMSGNSRSPGDGGDSCFSIDSNGTDVSEFGVGGEYEIVGLGALSCVLRTIPPVATSICERRPG